MPPDALLDKLGELSRRVRGLGLLYGLGIVALTASGLLLAVVAVDYLLNLPPIPRLIALLMALIGVGVAGFRCVFPSLSSGLSLTDVASRLEATFPQFNDRLRSTVEFLRGNSSGSLAMQRRVIDQTASLAATLDFNKAIETSPAYYSAAGATGAVVFLILLGLLAPTYSTIALSRLLTPFHAHPWPKRVMLQLMDAPPARLPAGQHLDLRVKITRGDAVSRKVSLNYQIGSGPVQREYMSRGPDGIYGSSLDTHLDAGVSTAAMNVWIEAGDDQVPLTPITIVPRLAIQSVQAEIVPPPYVKNRPAQMVNLATAPAVAAEGSTLRLHVQFNKSLGESAAVQIEPLGTGKQPPTNWSRESDRSVLGSWTMLSSLRFKLNATDSDAFGNNALEEYELIVRPDAAPSIQIENPRRNEERTPQSMIPLQVLAEDDCGIAAVMLKIDRIGDRKHWEIPLLANSAAAADVTANLLESTAEHQRMRLNYAWDLAALANSDLKPGDVLEYAATAKDNYALDGKEHPPVSSGKLRITLISQDDLNSRVMDDLRQVKQQITAVATAQDRGHQESGSFLDDTKNKSQLDTADKTALERLTDQQATAASQTHQIADTVAALTARLEENKSTSEQLVQTTKDVDALLTQVSENPMKSATQQLSSAHQPQRQSEQRNSDLKNAADSQQDASDQLQQALSKLADIGSLQTAIDGLRKMLEHQEALSDQTHKLGKDNLGKTPEQMSTDDRNKLKANADEQAKLAAQTEQAMADLQKLAMQLAKSDPASADALKKAADTGSQQNVSSNQKKASDSISQNRQTSAQAAQKQAELGLQQMLNDLREAERTKLAELQKKLEELQGQLANLIRRQAGHNLDNLADQPNGKLANLDANTRTALFGQAERDVNHPTTAPAVADLPAPQEQTEQNTRDIGTVAAALPDGAGPAGDLTRAADKMERAIVSLRDAVLPAAYEPPQVDALAALNRAKRTVDDQKAKVDQQLADKSKEAVRQKFMEIRADQVKLDDDTTTIDKVRDKSGALNRVQSVRLGQLPSEQGSLATRILAINEDLSAVNSTVYIWANKDIASSMTDVKASLKDQQTGEPVQTQQAAIVDQLDAMIRNLTTHPKESKFAQQGGGGKCNGGPKLPSEAELRLLQDLQRAVNKQTVQLDKALHKDPAALLDLGSRQAELRGLLDQTLQKASGGETKLAPEPDNRDQLPEEANAESLENNELDTTLLAGVPDEDKNGKEAQLIGDRMGRSRQRLALNDDPGKVTQAIQGKVITDLDYLIDQARAQTSQKRNPQNSPKPGEQMAKPKPPQAQVADSQGKKAGQPKQGGTSPAEQSQAPGQGTPNTDLTKDIRESASEWGSITPRLRDAAVDSAGESIVESYRKMIEAYYRSVAREGAGQQQ